MCIYLYINMRNCIILSLEILFSFIMLSSCSSMLAIGTAAFVGTVWHDPRTIGSQLDDNVLKIQIYHALYKNKQIKNVTRIINTVYQNNVLLTGQSPSIALSQEAIKIVTNIPGIKNIYDAIRLEKPISFQNILLDSLISNQVRFYLFIQKNIHISNIKVISENREVFLLGEVTHAEGTHAEKIVKNINGVKNVFTAFVYK